jgi:hypothetical protein
MDGGGGGGRGPAGDNTQQTSTTTQASTPEPTPPPAFGTGTEPYTPPKAEIVKAGQSFDHTLLDDALMQTKAFKEGSVSATYNPDTGKYTLTAFGVTSEKTPEEMADYAGGRTIADFQSDDPSLQTGEESIKQVAGPADVTATSVAAQDITAETATAEEAQMPGGFDSQNVARAFAEKTGLKYKIGSDGKIKFQDGQGNTFTRSPEDLVQEFGLEGDFGTSLKAQTYKASQVGDVGTTEAAQGKIEEDSGALAKVDPIVSLTQEAKGETLSQAEIDAAKGTAATRPEAKDYADAVTTDERFKIIEAEDPEVAQRILTTISEREKQDILGLVSKEGVNLDDIPEFKLAEKRTAQVGQAKTGIAQQLGEAPSVDFEGREAITGTAPQGDSSQIGGIPTMAASSMQAVTGEARKTAAADMMAVVGNMPPEVTAAISEDPATVEAQLDTGEDPTVTAAVAALPPEALVSVQMENLLSGMEEGKTPAWARPAVAAIEQQMAARGLSASTVGRDALFNAIIQSALPIAQSNAQALQQRAAQNLSNEQQANLASAQNTMQIRMQNLANRQTAASQTADMAQQIKVQQGQFKQQAKMTTADQQQQVRMQNIQNAQQKASQESAQRQQAALANLDAGTRMDLANLEALNLAGKENLNAEQQTKLANYQAKVDRIMRQAELNQDMEKANLDAKLRIEMQNLAEQNAAAKDTMSAENEERLVNLQTLVDFKKTNATLAQQMDLANLNNEQQMELANLAERAATDAANMTEANRMKLQEYTVYVDVMSKNEQLRQNAELAQLSAAEKMSLANMTAANQADSENMSAENMAELQVYEKKMQAAQVNAQLAQEMGLANLSNEQAAAMFNAQIDANMDMKQFDANQQMALANSQFMQTATLANLNNEQQAAMQNATAMANLDLATVDQRTKLAVQNAQAFLQMDMANLSNEQQANILDQQNKQQRMLSNQAAENAAKQFNATSENQTNQFMASMEANMNQFNTSQTNAINQFNTAEQNRIAAQNAGNQLQADQINAQITADVGKFNAQMDAQAEQWNAANAQAIEQSNIAWRRSANTAETAAQNAANQQQAAFQFDMDKTTQAQMWQQMRDQAAFNFQEGQSERDRLVNVVNAALSNEAFMTEKGFASQRSAIFAMLNTIKTGG